MRHVIYHLLLCLADGDMASFHITNYHFTWRQHYALSVQELQETFDIKGGCFYERRDIQVVSQLVRAAWSVLV